MIMNVNPNKDEENKLEDEIKEENNVEYTIEDNNYGQSDNNNDYPVYDETQNETDKVLYTDGEDKTPKRVLIIGGIILLLLIILICFIACGKLGKKDSNNSLSSIKVTNSDILPNFDSNIMDYNVITTKDIVTVTCVANSNSASITGCNKRIALDDVCIDHEIKVVAEDGSSRIYTLKICKQSENAPVIKDVTINPKTYTNSKVTVTVEVEEDTDLHEKAYSFDGGKNWQDKNTYEVIENKTLQIQVRNKDNNKSVILDKKITTIDKTNPSIVINGSTASGTETSSNVKLVSVVSPDSAPSGYKYQWYKGTSAIGGATSSSYTATSSGTYKVKVMTGAGNSKESNGYVVKIKATAKPTPTPTPTPTPNTPTPTITINSVTGNATTWTSNNVTLTINAGASAGLNSSAYSFDGGSTWQTSKSKTFSSNQTVNTMVRDIKGNKSSIKSVTINKIDTTTPSVSVSGNAYVGNKLSAVVTPVSTSSGYKYQWYKGTNAITNATSATYTPSSSGTYKVKVTTGAGKSDTSDGKAVSDAVTPNVSISGTVDSGIWSKNDITLIANTSNGTISSCKWYVIDSNGNSTLLTPTTDMVSINKSGTYKAEVTTSSGYVGVTNTYVAKIDKTPPTTPTVNLNTTSESASNVTFTITPGRDTDSGVSKTEYRIGDSAWTTYNGGTITALSTTGEKTIQARTKDNIGWETNSSVVRAKCDRDRVIIERDSGSTAFILKFRPYYSGLSGIITGEYQYVYWKAESTTDTSNNQSSQWSSKCGATPPSNATIRKTTNSKTISLYMKYNKQYYCFAVRPYRVIEYNNLNRWTVERKHATTTNSVDSSKYNGN